MIRVLAVDKNNDLYIAANGSLATADGLQAVMQAAQQAAQTQLAEMIYAVDQGVPNLQSVWDGAPNIPQFEAYLRAALLAVAGVTGVQTLEAQVVGDRLVYRATIQTIYGTGAVSG